MLTDALINRGGSKLEATRLFLERGLKIPIPRSAFLYAGQDVSSIKSEFEKLRKPIIVRGSHKTDWRGCVGAVPTLQNINSFTDLEKAIKEMEREMKTPEMNAFMVDDSGAYTSKLHFLVQEQSQSRMRGTMLLHPFSKWEERTLFVDYFDIDSGGEGRGDFYTHTPKLKSDGNWDKSFHRTSELSNSKELDKLVEMYSKIVNSGLVSREWAYQVEFGLEPLSFYQIKAFKLLEEARSFSLLDNVRGLKHLVFPDLIGATGEEGMVVDLKGVHPLELKNSSRNKPVCDVKRPYGLILQHRLSNNLPITVPLGKLEYFQPYAPFRLFHGTYRFMNRAQVTACGPAGKTADDSFNDDIIEEMENYTGKARVIANGVHGVLIPLYN
ncbi:MAG: hypothetical protein AABX70_03350 [Nanoarchaeota archaeon]